jgi:predicted  nucleic acid-binding Zn-ribbon protein
VDEQLRTLIELQALDTRIAALEADAARLPREIEAIRAAVEDAKKAVDAGRAQLDAARKDTRAREKDLEDTQVKRQKYEGQLYQVKTNKEYSAILRDRGGQAAQGAHRGGHPHLDGAPGAAGRRDQGTRSARSRSASAGRHRGGDPPRQAGRGRGELTHRRSDRNAVTRDLPPTVLGDYERVLRARGGLALVAVLKPNLCSGCRMTVTPQRLQELRQQNALIGCESCGRYLYWLA